MCLAVPGKLTSITGEGLLRTGRAVFAGVSKDINLAYAPEAGLGDYVLVHAGFAIGVVDPAAAERTLDALDRLEEPAAGSGAP